MKEDDSNVRAVCTDCIFAIQEWWQEKFYELPLEGLQVKARLETEDKQRAENLWIEVDYEVGEILRGYIVNDPVRVPYEYGDYIQFPRSAVIGHLSKDYSFEDYDRDCKNVVKHENHG